MRIPVTAGADPDTPIGYLEIDETRLPADQLKEMFVSWAFDSQEGLVLQMHLLPIPLRRVSEE